MIRRTEGIVLKTYSLGEADLIVTFLTPAYGLIKVFAKSPRKIKSRFGSSLEPLTCSRLAFWGKEDAALPRLTQADILHSFQPIRDDFCTYVKVSEILELSVAFVAEKDANEKAYILLYETLVALERELSVVRGRSSCSPDSRIDAQRSETELQGLDVIVNHYKVKLLKYTGFAPKLDTCGRCGVGGGSFYVSQGSILCESCAKGCTAPIEISAATKRLYQDLLLWDTANVVRIKPSRSLLSDLSGIIRMHIEHVLARPLTVGKSLLQFDRNCISNPA